MRIQQFTATTTRAALDRVKAALGPEAVILETATDECGQAVVTAATDEPATTDEPDETPESGELVREVRELGRLVRELVEGPCAAPEVAAPLRALHRALLAQGVDGTIAAALVRQTADRLEREPGSVEGALAGLLAAEVRPTRVRLFLGPPGDGKTTTIAKLAALGRRAGKRVALVSTDTFRIGAAAELAAYGRALGVPVERVSRPRDLRRALARVADVECVLVDTSGAGAGAEAELDELTALAAAAGPEAGRTLVLSAASGSAAGRQTCAAFAPLAPDACVLTKLDAAPGGAIMSLVWRHGLPVSHVAAGRRIPDDLEAATPQRLARCLLAA